jgi:hypothetical protein
MNRSVRTPHRSDFSQRASTYGQSKAAPGKSRMRAPTVTGSGSGSTRVTPNTTNAAAAATCRRVKRKTNQHDHHAR